jgi:hypothetical protein
MDDDSKEIKREPTRSKLAINKGFSSLCRKRDAT